VVAFWIAAVLAGQVAEPLTRPMMRVVCNTGYSEEICRTHARRLTEMLVTFDTGSLGEWMWILVRSEHWKPILRGVGRDPDSPAFTILEKRQTFLEEALFAATPDRGRTLLSKWRVPFDRLLEHATAHELGHALCREKEEKAAHESAGELLRTGRAKCVARGREKM
jgi:hypothetical protein